MTTKELIEREIAEIDATYFDELYDLIRQFARAKRQAGTSSLMLKLRSISIDAPDDFAANLDAYLSGEKEFETDTH